MAVAVGLAIAPAISQVTPPDTEILPSASTWPRITQMADRGPSRYSVMRHGTFGRHRVQYQAELSEMLVRDRAGELASSVFVTSFLENPQPSNSEQRPVLFIFNGGPGGASNTLMFGALGPERLQRFDSAALANPETALVANEDTIIDTADLAFVDAPETGFGRPLPGNNPRTFRSDDGDAFAYGQVILRWLADHHRLSAPVYLVGESYGSIRAVLLARDLLVATPRIEVAGLVLISEALTYNGPESFSIKHLPDPVQAINGLPDIATLSWYYGLIDNQSQSLEQAVRSAQSFALSDYAQALLAGNRLPEADRTRVALRLAALTGLSAEFWRSNNLRIDNVRRQLLAARGLAIAQFDGRETEPLADAPNDEDRDFQAATRGLTAATERFASTTFRETGLPVYRTIVADPYGFEKTWQFIAPPAPGADVVLREQMRVQPHLRLMVAQGVFDTTTSMGEADYLFSQLDTPQNRIIFARYVGGHILYSDDAGRRAFLNDLRAFVSGHLIPDHGFPKAIPEHKSESVK